MEPESRNLVPGWNWNILNMKQDLELHSYHDNNHRPCHSSGDCSSDFHHCGPGSLPGYVMWDVYWTKRDSHIRNKFDQITQRIFICDNALNLDELRDPLRSWLPEENYWIVRHNKLATSAVSVYNKTVFVLHEVMVTHALVALILLIDSSARQKSPCHHCSNFH
jgi:hypothetical protein